MHLNIITIFKKQLIKQTGEYFVKRKFHGATFRQVLLKWDDSKAEHYEQENCSTDDTLWFGAETKELHHHCHGHANENMAEMYLVRHKLSIITFTV